MSQNPFGQQQNPFGQQQGGGYGQQQPTGFEQQQNPFGQQPFGQQGFGGPSGFNQPIQPQKKGGGAFRTCLILTLVVVVCCGVCIGGSFVLALQNKPFVTTFLWIGLASQGNADQTGKIVCADSDAELFSVLFNDMYPNVTNISANNFEMNGNDVIITSGQITSDNGVEDFSATFTIDPDGKNELGSGLGSFGCVENIEWEDLENGTTAP